MTTQWNATPMALQADAVDAFLAYARIYFSSTERLTEIFLMTSRGAFDDCAAASKASVASAGPTTSAAHVALSQAMLDRTMTFSRDAYESVTRTHLEAAKFLAQRIATQGVHLPSSAFAFHDRWNDAFGMFIRGIPPTHTERSTTMSKVRKGNKETKKPAAHTAKEKKAAKQAKKHASDTLPIIPH